jgi:hypothetical protein
LIDAHLLVPVIGDGSQTRVESCSQPAEQIWEWIFEIAILSLAEAVLSHTDMTPEMPLLKVERSHLLTLFT